MFAAGTVLATFSGTGPHFSGSHRSFKATTCVFNNGAGGISVYVNTDKTVTLGSLTGFHLLTPQ